MYCEYTYVSEQYNSNCFIEALRAKLQHPFKVKIYYCKSRRRNGKFDCCHFLWSDGEHDYDFTDKDTYTTNRFLHRTHLWYPGMVRQWPLGFAEEYSKKRNHSRQ